MWLFRRRCKERYEFPTFTLGFTRRELRQMMQLPYGRCELHRGHEGKHQRRNLRWD